MQHFAVLPMNTPVSTVKVGVRSAPAPFDGQLVRLVFTVGVANSNGASTFDVRRNGVSIFADPAERPVIASGQRSIHISGLEIAVSESDVLSWDAVGVPLGGLSAPVTCTAVLDDGQPAGLNLEEADGAPAMAATLLVVGNGDLTDEGGGVARLRTIADVLGQANGAASLDASGKVQTAQLPALAISDVFPVSSQAAMLALTAQRGDVAARSDVNKNFILAADDPTQLANWVEYYQPTSATPSGAAGGSLTGSYPNPTLAPGVVTQQEVASANKDGAAATPSMRTLGTGAQQAAAGNDSRLSDSRTPSGAAGGDLSGTYPAPSVAGLKGRSLGGLPAVSGVLQDDFTDNIFNTTIWARSSSVDVVEQNARLEMRNANWFQDATTHNFTDKWYAWSQVADVWARLHFDADNYLEFRVSSTAGTIRFLLHTPGGGDSDVASSLTYHTVNHKFLKFEHRSSDGKVHYLTSPDGVTWTDQASVTPPVAITATWIRWFGLLGTFTYVDDVTSNVLAADAIAGSDKYMLGWDNGNNWYKLTRTLGIVPITAAPPSGVPVDLPVGHSLLMLEMTTPATLWSYNTVSGNWEKRLMNS